MSRRSTDLLDVFRSERAQPGRGAAGRASDRGPDAEPRAGAGRRAFQGLFLEPRQLLLGSSVVVLLLVFAFVLGLSVGRRGATPGAAALARTEGREAAGLLGDDTRVFVLGRVPYMDMTRATQNEPQTLFRSLTEMRTVPADRLWILDEKESQAWVVVLGPFPDKPRAAEFLRQLNLTRARVGGSYPFEAPEYRSLPVAGMPRERLPAR